MRKITLVFNYLLITFLFALPLAAQDVLQTQGIAGDIDKGYRSPLLTVSTSSTEGKATILVDVLEQRSEYAKYPIQVDFFVNRRLVSSQIRSPELPGALGVDIGTEIATVPFNYSIVATLLHPNRTYTSVLNGAVFASNLIATLDCSLTVTEGSGSGDVNFEQIFIATGVNTVQTTNDSLSLTFTATTSGGDDSAAVSTTLTAIQEEISGPLQYTIDGTTRSAQVTGTITTESGKLTEIDASDEAGAVTLNCE